MNRSYAHVLPVYDAVIQRTQKYRHSSIEVDRAFLVCRTDHHSPITISRHITDPDAISLQVRLNGYCVAPLAWFRDRGIDPVMMRDESREYRETFLSSIRRWTRRLPETFYRVRHPLTKRVIDVERI